MYVRLVLETGGGSATTPHYYSVLIDGPGRLIVCFKHGVIDHVAERLGTTSFE
jgi:hypothetical protein